MNGISKSVWYQLTDKCSATSGALTRALGELPKFAVVSAYGLLLVVNCMLHGVSPGRLPTGNEKHFEAALAAAALTEDTAAEPRPPHGLAVTTLAV